MAPLSLIKYQTYLARVKYLCRFPSYTATRFHKIRATGRCSLQSIARLELPTDTAASIANWSNLAITKKTWSTYKTAEVMLKKCSADGKIDMSLPLTQKQVLVFVDWLARVRGLKGATFNSY
jgi:hypothetical protein